MLACEVWGVAVNQLDNEELSFGYFQEDGATSHTSHASMAEIQSFSATASFRRDFGHIARPIWRRLIISYGDIWKGEFTKLTTNHRRLESKLHQRNSGSDNGRTGKDFPKYGAPGSILSGRKWWPLPVHVMMSSHFSHNERTPVQISLQYLHWC